MLGADSLGLVLEAVDEATVRAEPPLDSTVRAGDGDKGAMVGAWAAGAATTEGGGAVVGIDVLWVAAAAAAAAAAWD